jgi:hypothetical protein
MVKSVQPGEKSGVKLDLFSFFKSAVSIKLLKLKEIFLQNQTKVKYSSFEVLGQRQSITKDKILPRYTKNWAFNEEE